MKTHILLLFFVLFGISCQENNDLPIDSQKPIESQQQIVFKIAISNSNLFSKANGPLINNPVVLDSLVKDLRVLVFDNATGKCESYADYNPIYLSQTDTVRLLANIGVKDFMFLTNVCNDTIMSKNVIGKLRSQIYINQLPYPGSNPNLSREPLHHFKGDVLSIPIIENTLSTNNVSLVRFISQLETKANIDSVWTTKLENGINVKDQLIPSIYIVKIRSLVIDFIPKYIASDITVPNISNPVYTSVVNDDWTNGVQVPRIATSTTLSFPTLQLSALPQLLFACEVNTSSPFYSASPGDLILPNGNAIRYWGFQLNNSVGFQENKRIQLTINNFIGTGSSDPGPKPNAMVDFIISIADFDLNHNNETGTDSDFLN